MGGLRTLDLYAESPIAGVKAANAGKDASETRKLNASHLVPPAFVEQRWCPHLGEEATQIAGAALHSRGRFPPERRTGPREGAEDFFIEEFADWRSCPTLEVSGQEVQSTI